MKLSYLVETKEKVEDFLRKKKVVLQTETQYLGGKSMKIQHSTIKEILGDLEKEKKVKILRFNLGNQKFTQIEWVGKK